VHDRIAALSRIQGDRDQGVGGLPRRRQGVRRVQRAQPGERAGTVAGAPLDVAPGQDRRLGARADEVGRPARDNIQAALAALLEQAPSLGPGGALAAAGASGLCSVSGPAGRP
jgi:hypothetical protein